MANGEIHNGETFNNQTFGDGCLFENCTFYASCRFGNGCVFVNCTFIRVPFRPFSWVDEGATFETCTLDWVEIDSRGAFNNCTFLAVTIGPECVINTVGTTIGAGTHEQYNGALGEQIAGDISANHDWCSYRCKPGRYIIGKGQSDVGISGDDFGRVWSE